MYYYTAYTLTFASDFCLPEYVETLQSLPDVRISKLPESQDHESEESEILVKELPDGISFDWDGFGRYDICNGCKISVSPRRQVSGDIIRIPLYNVALAAVLQQNSFLVLHGSAVEINGRASILLGNKGYGKSSLTAALLKRGHRLLSDDVTAISFTGPLMILPGIPILKLWPNTMNFVGLEIKDTRLFYPGITKRLCILKEQFCNTSIPVGAIFVLNYGDAMELQPIQGLRKLLNLSGFQYFAHFREAFSLKKQKSILELCHQLAENVDMYKFIRPVDLGGLEGACRMIESL